MQSDPDRTAGDSSNRPYAMLGADNLTASLWKYGSERSGFHYRFNIFRLSPSNGRVSQRLVPKDLVGLLKLVRVLAFTLADDGCLDEDLHDTLCRLRDRLEQLGPFTEEHDECDPATLWAAPNQIEFHNK